jgi:hypothetical protein
MIPFFGFLPLTALAIAVYSIAIWQTSTVIHGERYFALFDDAMISMTYARSLAEGYGLRWNSIDPPVEGYTNLLWTLGMAVLHLFPIPESKICLVVMVFCAGLLIATAWGAARLAYRAAGRVPALMAYGLTLLSFPLFFWSIRGMEVGLIACLSVWAANLVLAASSNAGSWRLRILLGLLLLTRMDAALIVGLMVVLSGLSEPSVRSRVAVISKNATWCAAVLAIHTLVRWWYYHDVLPNTYTLKVAGFPLLMRLTGGVGYLWSAIHVWLPPVLVAVCGCFNRSVEARRMCFYSLGIFLVQVAYSAYVGGDAWELAGFLNRYLSQAIPFLAVASTIGCLTISEALFAAYRPVAVTVASLVLAVGLLGWCDGPAYYGWRKKELYLVGQDMSVVHTAIAIREATTPDARVAVVMAGVIPYFSRRACTDLLGKSDPVIARDAPHWLGWFYPGHMKWNYEHSLKTYNPDLIHQLWFASPQEKDSVLSLGYERLGNGMYVKQGTSKVDRSKLL